MLARVLGEALVPFDAAGDHGVPKAKDGSMSATADDLAAIARFVMQRYGGRPKPEATGTDQVGRAGSRATHSWVRAAGATQG